MDLFGDRKIGVNIFFVGISTSTQIEAGLGAGREIKDILRGPINRYHTSAHMVGDVALRDDLGIWDDRE